MGLAVSYTTVLVASTLAAFVGAAFAVIARRFPDRLDQLVDATSAFIAMHFDLDSNGLIVRDGPSWMAGSARGMPRRAALSQQCTETNMSWNLNSARW